MVLKKTVNLGVYRKEKDARDALWKYFTLQKNSDEYIEKIQYDYFKEYQEKLTREDIRECLTGDFQNLTKILYMNLG